jgi:4-coumarate--CoA ligase
MRAKYVSENGTALPAGSTGELCVKGPNIFAGYLRNSAATVAALTADGYFRTGDIGHQDGAGNFFITDRIKELIKYKGFQVAPAELEGLLLGHKMVADVCVVGVYDEGMATELPRAFVVRTEVETGREGKAEEEQLGMEIAAWLAERVASYKRLRGGVVFVKEIPRTASGKILRRVIREDMEITKPTPKL